LPDELKRSVARTLDSSEAFVPHLPELLQDLWSMGSPPERILEILKPLNLARNKTRVLDLGCGKGAVAVTLARNLGFRVLGIDGCREFIEDGRKKAAEFGVEALCDFKVEDIRQSVKALQNYDVAIYASVGHVLGSPSERIGKLRGCVRPGGYILIDDGYLKVEADYYEYLPHDETVSQLKNYGDRLLKEIVHPDEELTALDREYFRLIKRRGGLMIKRRPDLKALVRDYINNQEQECEKMERCFRSATWLLQRADR
jgi:2-polyprenyl-3-methyl-5-hydroxy-6-metoxy-1,4-benzoquinol methylase